MNVAVCLSGCPRDWRRGVQEIEKVRGWIEDELGRPVRFSYFLALWDFISPSVNFDRYEDLCRKYNWVGDSRYFHFTLTQDEVREILEVIEPVDFKIYNFEFFKSLIEEHSIGTWLNAPSYLMLESLRLRRQFELKHERFDLVVWSRTDVQLGVKGKLNLDSKELKGSSIYRFSESRGEMVRGFKDQFFYGKGPVVDLGAYIYRLCYVDRVQETYEYIEETFRSELERAGIPLSYPIDIKLSRYEEEQLLEGMDKRYV